MKTCRLCSSAKAKRSRRTSFGKLARCGDQVFGNLYTGQPRTSIAAEAEGFPATLSVLSKTRRAIGRRLETRYAMELEKRGASRGTYGTCVSASEEAIGGSPASYEFHRKHPAFLTLLADAPLSKDAIEQKAIFREIFVDNTSPRCCVREIPNAIQTDALGVPSCPNRPLRGFLPGLAGRKTTYSVANNRSLNQMMVRYWSLGTSSWPQT